MTRLLLDMGLSPRTAATLRSAGYDADHVVDRGPDTLADEHILVLAHAENRVIVTFDLDFPRLLALNRATRTSTILFRVQSATTERLTAWLLDLLPRYAVALEVPSVLVVDDRRERIHVLTDW